MVLPDTCWHLFELQNNYVDYVESKKKLKTAIIKKSVWVGFPNSNLHRGLIGYLSGQNKPGLSWHEFHRWLDTMVGIAN